MSRDKRNALPSCILKHRRRVPGGVHNADMREVIDDPLTGDYGARELKLLTARRKATHSHHIATANTLAAGGGGYSAYALCEREKAQTHGCGMRGGIRRSRANSMRRAEKKAVSKGEDCVQNQF